MCVPHLKLPTIRHSEIVASSRLFSIETLDLQFSNGEERIYERLPKRAREAVIICTVTREREIVLINEYMAGIHAYELGLPKGVVHENESLEDAANRELKEEVGLGARDIRYIRELSIAPGQMGFSIHAMLARDLYEESLPGDEPEPLEVVRWPLDKIDDLMFNERISEARSLAALRLAQILINNDTV